MKKKTKKKTTKALHWVYVHS